MKTISKLALAMPILLLSISLRAQTTSPVFSDPKKAGFFKPKIEVEGGANYDFGNIYRGQKVTHVFTITNSGTDTLIISNVSSSCGCTAALASSSRIAPKSKTELNVTFNSEGYNGRVTKTATVSSNDPDHPHQLFTVSANVQPVFETTPYIISFTRARVDSLSTTSVQIKNSTDRRVKILSSDATVPGLQIEVSKKTLNPNEIAELKANFKPTKEGLAWGEVTLTTDFQPQPKVSIRFSSNVAK